MKKLEFFEGIEDVYHISQGMPEYLEMVMNNVKRHRQEQEELGGSKEVEGDENTGESTCQEIE